MLQQFLDWVFIDNAMHNAITSIQVSIHQSMHKILMKYSVRSPY
jgi:hypothetical protein